ncbi:sensor histidine kinase [Streptomyces sp. DSM 40750]|uniref:sensor histidine kinase n=1 Tax=Streptomyces sp. DSM 40750 TaxID=2801030 RepID=UPI00214BBF36|nr:nitrate- and nitrite sensing domain-containing protein [Streptomyces sp. DSM 40750]UUU20594.1 nitrate- and nitrite sensing domain-containing protein [Streptomyces sp. DSM 40750]
MRFRGKSIRRKIVALLLVPLVALTGVWTFATVLTGREASDLFRVADIVEEVGFPTEDTIRVLQQERRQTLVYLADPRASEALTALERSRSATDEAVDEFRAHARDSELRDEMGEATSLRLTAILDALDGLPSLRTTVENGTVTVPEALGHYNNLVDPCFTLLSNLPALDSVEMDKQGRALVNVGRARELLSREDALLSSVLVADRITQDEIRDFSDLVAQRTLMYDISLPQLPSSERDRFQRYWRNANTAPLRSVEQAVIASDPGEPSGVTAKSWDTAVEPVLSDLRDLSVEAGDRYQDRVRPLATDVILKAAVAGVLGLFAVLFSLFMSVRIGRVLIRDLRKLRQEAHETAGVRLPSVMRRLAAGEQVDVETEVPRLEYDKNEIGEVSRALNTLQRAAVEAAVKQSELRSGISEVFVNLARRSQVLLHKQLTLLDTMERRTEDTDELADLFRLDHLTTRMRRHAEGLVILSGAAPSRQWRKPIQLMDVVRAAVAEVEDYERIEVRRLPRVAVTGPAVADLTHLVAELLENATVFSPPHTAVQVLGERVANGFTLEIHDRGLGMSAEALLDANLKLAETPDFELSDTDRLGLFVVSRLAQRQKVRVSLQPSPYGGTTAVVFIPDALLTDDVPDTNGIGFRLDRAHPTREAELEEERNAALSQVPVRLPGLSAAILDGPVELEAPVELEPLAGFPGALDDEDGERGGLFRPRRSLTGVADEQHPARDGEGQQAPLTDPDPTVGPVPLPQRRTPHLVSSHGRSVTGPRPRHSDDESQQGRAGGTEGLADTRPLTALRGDRAEPSAHPGTDRNEPGPLPGAHRAGALPAGGHEGPALPQRRRTNQSGGADPTTSQYGVGEPTPRTDTTTDQAESVPSPLPRRVRQANLAPQLKDGPERRAERERTRPERRPDPTERDADEVRSRMASLQRGWQRGREENVEGDDAHDVSAPRGTIEGDGR